MGRVGSMIGIGQEWGPRILEKQEMAFAGEGGGVSQGHMDG